MTFSRRRRTIFYMALMMTTPAYSGQLVDRSSHGYVAYLPKEKSGVKWPILVAFPGWGVPARQDLDSWAFNSSRRGFILLDFDVDYRQIKTQEDARELFDRVHLAINHLTKDGYPLDSNEIYVAGNSAGGMIAISLALIYPDKFKAVGVVSGADLRFGAGSFLSNADSARFFLVHGAKDDIVTFDKFLRTKTELEKHGALVKTVVFELGDHNLNSAAYQQIIDYFFQISTSGKNMPPSEADITQADRVRRLR